MSTHAFDTLTATRTLPPLASVVFGVAWRVIMWERRRSTRRALGTLDDHMLRDIGMNGATARAEALKPFWRA